MSNEQERIKADAERFTKDEGYQKAYIAGATAVHDRAKVLVDALEKLAVSCQELFDVKNSTNKKNIKLNAWNDLAFKLRDAENVLQKWKSGKGKEDRQWQPIETAPKDGSTIEVTYDKEGKETCLACWSDNPICMLGPRNGSFPPGWATAVESDCDTNLPLDPPLMWRPY